MLTLIGIGVGAFVFGWMMLFIGYPEFKRECKKEELEFKRWEEYAAWVRRNTPPPIPRDP